MCCKADMFLHSVCNAKQYSMLVENNHLIQFQYSNFLILINPFTTITGIGKVYFDMKRHSDEVKADLMFANMEDNIFLIISIIILPRVFIRYYPVHFEKLAVIYYDIMRHSDEVKAELMFANREDNIFLIISIIILPRVFTRYHPVHFETLAVIHWKICAALRCQTEI